MPERASSPNRSANGGSDFNACKTPGPKVNLFFFSYDYLIFPLLRILAFAASGLGFRKIAVGLQERKPINGIYPWLSGPQNLQPIWIHCSSGEFEYAKPVIAQIKVATPHAKILVTYFSPTMRKAIETFNGVDFSCPLPWDTPENLSAFMKYYRPHCLLIARTDVWPEMARQSRRHSIPSLLFSTTLSSESKRMRGTGAWLTKKIYGHLTSIFCVSVDDLANFAKLGLDDKTTVAGDTRYDQVMARLLKPKALRLELFENQSKPVFVAGSTWPDDEAALLAALTPLLDRLQFILVPHEPHEDHLKSIERAYVSLGIKTVRYSTAEKWQDGVVLLVDKVGILAELYAQAEFAFVGGSYQGSVHSVMEPLAAGCPTLVGPFHHNNREALEFQKIKLSNTSITPVLVAPSAEMLSSQLRDLLALPASELNLLKIEIKNQIKTRSGQSRRVVDWIAQNPIRSN
jgi:3-deoxy-D-manno-octulosonic-acid transferase